MRAPTSLLVLATAACGGARPTPAPAPAVPAAHYARLFADGAAWTYQVTTSTETNEPDDPRADQDGNVRASTTARVRCRVALARRWSAGVMSRIECDQPIMSNRDPLAGAWVADARGLYKIDDLPAAGDPDLVDARVVIAAAPVAGESRHDGQGDEAGFGESTKIEQKGAAWCVTYASWGGDESYDTLCFAGDVVRGAGGWSGGSSHDTTFELVR